MDFANEQDIFCPATAQTNPGYLTQKMEKNWYGIGKRGYQLKQAI
jgi:hypothetical protein